MGEHDSIDVSISQKTVFDSVFITVVYALFWACLILNALFPGFAPMQKVPLFFDFPYVVVGLLSFILVQWTLKRRPLLYTKEKFTLVLGFAFLLSLPTLSVNILVAIGLLIPWWIILCSWICWGLSTGFLFPLLGAAWSLVDQVHGSRKSSPKLICVSFIGAAFLASVAIFVPLVAYSVLMTFYSVGLFALFAIVINRLPEIRKTSTEAFLEKFNPTESPKRFFPIVIGITLAITAGYSMLVFAADITLMLCAGACLVAGLLMFVGVHSARMPIVNESIERAYFPIAAVCFFFVVLLPTELQVIPLFILFVDFFVYIIFHWAFLLAQSHRYSFSSPYHFSLGLLNPALGLLFGGCVAFLLFLVPDQIQVFGSAFFGLAVLFVIVVSVVPYAADPLFEIDVLDPDITELMDEESRGLWRKKCHSLATRAGLSPREEEVFDLLARGRNAQYIQKKLFISINTAKTHKHRIFQKLRVGTQQELIDAIEKEIIT